MSTEQPTPGVFPMNKRNVVALWQAIAKCDRTLPTFQAQLLAERLSAEGVLVPSALTLEQCKAVAFTSSETVSGQDRGPMIETLTKIAKGETP